jgi:hypothetical protein
MSKRLQVVVDDAELRRFQKAAKSAGVTLAEWVRQALRSAEREKATGDIERKIAAVRQGLSYSFPAPDIDDMLNELEQGYSSSLPE